MKNWKKTLAVLQAALFVICVLDAVLTWAGVPGTNSYWNRVLGNILTAIYFVPMAMTMIFAWREWDEGPVKLVRLYAGVVLLGVSALLVLTWVLIPLGLPVFVQNLVLVLMMLVSIPAFICSTSLFVPFFLWAVMLIASWMMVRKMNHK